MKRLYEYIRPNIVNHDTLTLSVVLFLSALIVRTIIFFQGPVVSNDAVFYITLAKSILSGSSEHTSFTFFSAYPFLIAFVYKIIPDWEIAGKVVSILSGSLAVIPLYILFSGLLGKRVAIIAGFLYVFGPRFVEYSTDILRESTFWLFSFTSLCFAWKGIDGKKLFYLGFAALFAALSFTIRIEGIAIFPIIILWTFYAVYSKEISLEKGIQSLVVFTLVIPLLFLPLTLLIDYGSWSWIIEKIVGKGRYLLEGQVLSGQETMRSEALKGLPFTSKLLYELAEKYKYLIYSVEIFFKTFKSMTAIPVILLIAGLFLRKNLPFKRKEIYFVIWVCVFFIVSIYYIKGTNYFSTRHGLLIGIPALAFSSIGFLEFRARLSSLISIFKCSPWTKMIVLTTFTCLIFTVLFVQSVTSLREDKMGLKTTGLELKEKGYGESVMLVQPGLQRLAFYADAEFVVIPEGTTMIDIIKIMKNNNAMILVVDIRTIDRISPIFKRDIDLNKFEEIKITGNTNKFSKYSLSILKLKE